MANGVCNKCGRALDMWDKISGMHVEMELGYGSKYDGDFLHLELCNKCLDELAESCAINPIIDLGA